MLKLSIITINRNNVQGLRKTIESVINQTFRDFENIIIDGDSNDGSLDIIKEYSNRITCWVSEPDSGIYNAMNKGIRKAIGEYCLFLNSGDCLISNNILTEVFSLNYTEDFLYSDVAYYNEMGGEIITSLPQKLNIQFFYKSSLWHQATFIKRDLFKEYGLYNESNKLISDWEFFFKRIIFDQCSYMKIEKVITNYDMYDGISVKENDLRLKEFDTSISNLVPKYLKELTIDYFSIENEIKDYKRSIFYKFYKKFKKLQKVLHVKV